MAKAKIVPVTITTDQNVEGVGGASTSAKRNAVV